MHIKLGEILNLPFRLEASFCDHRYGPFAYKLQVVIFAFAMVSKNWCMFSVMTLSLLVVAIGVWST